MIFHSQGHSSSTESDLSSLIPVEIPAPVLEVFEDSANEVGAQRLSAYNEKVLGEVIKLQLHSHSYHSSVCHSKMLKQRFDCKPEA